MKGSHDIVADEIREYYLKHKIKHREEVLNKCGKDAFLKPAKLGYPVVDPKTCKIDCGLVKAAYIRARQFKDSTVLSRISKLREQCGLKD